MDDHFCFPPPIEYLPSLTWEQIISKEKHWANHHQSSPRFIMSPTINGDSSPYFKTQMCLRFKFRRCPNGDTCNFAHAIEEIRRTYSYTQNPSNPNPYGRFKHSEDQKLDKIKFYSQQCENWKRKSCPHWSAYRQCPFRQKCIYAHVDEELTKLSVDSWEAGGKSVRPGPFKVNAILSERKINQQPASLPMVTDLTLEKCKRVYGDWID